jgi:peptidoglycan/xylan/chitin deacetylase (PgdA/CDA1 family)
VEDHFGNAQYALDSLRAANVRGTFFLTSDLALKNPRLAARLGEEGEVGTHSENHRLLGGTPPDAQRQRLEKSQHDLTEMFGNGVRGLRPPQEQFDAATMAGWLSAGGTYMVGANDSRSVGPELLPVGADTLVLLSRNSGDDFTAVREGHREPSATAAVFLRDYQRIRALGGLYILSYHSQLLSTPELVPALARVAREISTDSLVWPTTAGAVATWWRSRAELDVRVRQRGAGALDVIVQNRGSELVLGAVAQVRMNSPRRVIHTSTAQLVSEPGLIRVRLPPLPPRETRIVNVTFAAPAAARSRDRTPAVTHHRRSMRTTTEKRPPWWAPWRW